MMTCGTVCRRNATVRVSTTRSVSRFDARERLPEAGWTRHEVPDVPQEASDAPFAGITQIRFDGCDLSREPPRAPRATALIITDRYRDTNGRAPRRVCHSAVRFPSIPLRALQPTHNEVRYDPSDCLDRRGGSPPLDACAESRPAEDQRQERPH